MERVAMDHEPIHCVRLDRPRRYAKLSNDEHAAPNSNVADILQLIKQGDEQMDLSDQYKSATLVLGNTGSGKSTFVQWIAEKDAELLSKELSGDSGEFIIVDTSERISNNTLESKTIFPELVVDNKTNIAYYDCPGFSDTRSAANDIAQTYFVKKLSGHLTKVKLVFVINHTSVKPGIDRKDFPDLLAQASALVPNIDKFERSISLVVSKVEPPYDRKRRQVASDEQVMTSIADFLRSTRDYFVKRTTDSSLSQRERSLAESSIKFIDIFLIKDGGDYSRLSLFKRPDDEGPLDQIESMVEGKESVHKVLHDTLQYTEMQDGDLDYTVSDKSKNDISSLTSEIDRNVWSAVGGMIEKIKSHFTDSTDSLLNHLKTLRNGTTTADSKQKVDAGGLLKELATAGEVASSLAKNLSGATTDRLAEEIKQGIMSLKIAEVDEDLSSISSQGKLFKFLQAFSDVKLALKPWGDLFKPLESYLTNLKQKLDAEIKQTAEVISSEINSRIVGMIEKIEQHFQDSTDSLLNHLKTLRNGTTTADSKQKVDAGGLLKELATAGEVASSLAKNLSGATADRLAEEMKQGIMSLKISGVDEDLSSISSQGKSFKFLQGLSDAKFAPKPWGDLFKPLGSNLTDLNQKSGAEIKQTAQIIHSKINSTIADVNKDMKRYYGGRINVVPLHELPSEFSKARIVIQVIEEPHITQVTAQELLRKIELVTSKLDINSNVIERSMADIAKLANNLRYIDTIIEPSGIFDQAEEWRSPFKELINHLEESATWYRFLSDLSEKLSSYDEQKNKTVYGGGTITKDSFRNFLLEINKLQVAESSAVGGMVNDDRVEELNRILDITVRNDVRITCLSDTLVVEGNFVKFSDFVTSKETIEKRDCGKGTKGVNIFALNKLFFDRHLKEVGQKMVVAAFAPIWEIVDNIEINLSGSDGEAHSTPAKYGGHGREGEDGKAGLSGGPAGTFFGITSKLDYKSLSKLSIFADGGNGGPGQTGGLGGNGTDGKTPPKETSKYVGVVPWSCKCSSSDTGGTIMEFPYEQNCYYSQRSSNDAWGGSRVTTLVSCDFDIFGISATNGANGGHGGMGGKGGRPGDVRLIIPSSYSFVSTSNRPGNLGELGAGGAPGSGGVPASNHKMKCTPKSILNAITLAPSWEYLGSSCQPAAGSGSPGVPGGSAEEQKEPEKAAVIFNLPRVINDYKIYLIRNMKYRIDRPYLMDFLDAIESADFVKNAYRTLDLIDEMKRLEQQSRNINFEKEIAIPFYESLLNRTAEYAKNPRLEVDSTLTPYQQNLAREKQLQEHKKALAFLYTAILSKLHFLRADSEYTTITDINRYLEQVEASIKTLSQTQESSNKLRVIDQYKQDYKSEIDKKVAEANHFIENQLEPEVKKIEEEIDKNMDDLVKSILDSRKKAHEDVEKAAERAAKLAKQMQIKMAFSVLKFASNIVKVAGPWGAAAGAAIDATTGVADHFLLKKDDKEVDGVKVAQDVAKHLSKGTDVWKTFREKSIKRLKKKVEAIKDKVSKVPKLKEVSDELEKISFSADNLEKDQEPDSSGLSDVEKIKKKLTDLLDDKKKELEKDKEDPEATIEVLKHVKKVFGMADGLFDIYDKYKECEKDFDKATKDIKAKVGDVEKWYKAEKAIYSDFAPFMKDSKREMKEVVEGLGTKSGVALQVQKWQVQKSLMEMRKTIKKTVSVSDSDIEGNMLGCVEKLSEVITTLINIYDRIQDYQEQQKLGNYIGDISSASANNINVTDQALGRAVTELEVSIRSNLLLEQYHTAVLTVKQWVFPFAHDYLVDFDAMLPSQLEIKADDIRQLANKAKNHMTEVKKKVHNYKISIQKSDKFIHHAIFDGDNIATLPFYVWKNEAHRDDISRLLSGDEVAFNADVLRGSADKDAVKFNLLEVNLRSRNETLQSELKEKMRHFKVSATHMGNSYYRYKNKFYVIASESLQIVHHFSKKNGEPVDANSVYNKIKSGDIMFSPYAMWKIKLSLVTDKISFNDLMAFKNLVDVELEGKGSYISDSDQIPDFNPGEYYELDENTLQMSNHILSKVHQNPSRRFFAMPVASSASRPSSWLYAAVSFGRQLVERLSGHHVHPVPPRVNDGGHLINLKTSGASDLLGISQPSSGSGPKVLQMGDVLFNNTDVNGLLTWGTLLARKWSGYRPRAARTVPRDESTSIVLSIRSHELVDVFMRRVEQLARSRGMQSSGAMSDHTLYANCVSVVREKLARGEDDTLAASLVELVRKTLWQLDQDDLDWLLSEVTGDLDHLNEEYLCGKMSSSMSSNSEQCVYISPPVESASLRKYTGDLDSLYQSSDLKLFSQSAFDESLAI